MDYNKDPQQEGYAPQPEAASTPVTPPFPTEQAVDETVSQPMAPVEQTPPALQPEQGQVAQQPPIATEFAQPIPEQPVAQPVAGYTSQPVASAEQPAGASGYTTPPEYGQGNQPYTGQAPQQPSSNTYPSSGQTSAYGQYTPPQETYPQQPVYQPETYPQQGTYQNTGYSQGNYQQPNYNQGGYQQGYYPPPLPQTVPGKGKGVASLVLGIIGFVLTWFLIPAPLSLILGIIGVILANQAKNELPPHETGMAVGGLVMSIISLVLGAVITIFFVAVIVGSFSTY